MNIKLIEGDGNLLAVKGELHLLLHIIECIPVVAAVAPGKANYVYGACSVLFYGNYGSGLLEDKLTAFNNIGNNLLCSGKILVVGDGINKVEPSAVFCVVVYKIT